MLFSVSLTSLLTFTADISPSATETGHAFLPLPRRWCCGFWIGKVASGAGVWGRVAGVTPPGSVANSRAAAVLPRRARRGDTGHLTGLTGDPPVPLIPLQPSENTSQAWNSSASWG